MTCETLADYPYIVLRTGIGDRMSDSQALAELAIVLLCGFALMMIGAVLASRLTTDRRGLLARAALTALISLVWITFGDVMPNGLYRWRFNDNGLKIAGVMAVSFGLVMLLEWALRTLGSPRPDNGPPK